MDYVNWLIQVDAILTDLCGIGHRDLPDFNWMDMFEDGISPKEAAEVYTLGLCEGEDQSLGDVLGLYDERQEF